MPSFVSLTRIGAGDDDAPITEGFISFERDTLNKSKIVGDN